MRFYPYNLRPPNMHMPAMPPAGKDTATEAPTETDMLPGIGSIMCQARQDWREGASIAAAQLASDTWRRHAGVGPYRHLPRAGRR